MFKIVKRQRADLVIIQWQVIIIKGVVEVQAPVGDHHPKGGGEESSDGDLGAKVTTIEKTQHGYEEDGPKEDIQIPQQSKLLASCLTKHIQLETHPQERDEQAKAGQHQAVQLDTPGQGGEGGT